MSALTEDTPLDAGYLRLKLQAAEESEFESAFAVVHFPST